MRVEQRAIKPDIVAIRMLLEQCGDSQVRASLTNSSLHDAQRVTSACYDTGVLPAVYELGPVLTNKRASTFSIIWLSNCGVGRDVRLVF